MTRATDDVDADVEIADGKITMSATDGEAVIYVDTPELQPLGREQRHATVRVVGDEFKATVELDFDGLEALADAVTAARSSYQGPKSDR